MILADGWAGAPFGFPAASSSPAPLTMFFAELTLQLADGSTQTIHTDATWKWRTGPITKHSIYNGETYDARKELPGWSAPRSKNRGWKPVETTTAPEVELTPKKCPPVRAIETLAPTTLRTEADSAWLADFSQNLVGLLRIKLRNTTPGQHITAAKERLLEKLDRHELHLSIGFLGTPLLNPVLSKIGHTDIAYKLLLTDTYPSWLYPITNGATTMWERWNSWTKDKGFGPVDMNSFNHYAYGAIGEWLYQTVAGIALDPDCPGYARAIIAPQPDPRMKRAKASLQTRAGLYRTQWKLGKEHYELQLTIPESAQATVRLPTTKWARITLNGKAIPKAKKQTSPKSNFELQLTGGEYKITLPTENLA